MPLIYIQKKQGNGYHKVRKLREKHIVEVGRDIASGNLGIFFNLDVKLSMYITWF